MSKISELISFALIDQTNTDKAIKFGTIPNFLSQIIKQKTGIDVKGEEKALNARQIRNKFSGHGDKLLELERGQIGITKTDFKLLPEILVEPDYYCIRNKSSNGRINSLLFVKVFNDKAYCIVMSKVKSDLTFTTMYIKKIKPM